MSKCIGENISRKLSSKNSQKLFDHAKQFTTDALKTALNRVKIYISREKDRKL